MKKKKKPKIHRDNKGEYIRQNYFIRGKQKYQKIYVIDGIPVDEFYRQNADPISLFQDGEYKLLEEHSF